MNIEMPFEPIGAPSMRASTRWMMFVGEIVLAPGDENLLAGDGVGAIGLRHRLGGERAEVGAGLRLGQVHGAGPFAGDEFGEIERPSDRARRAARWLRWRASVSIGSRPKLILAA